MGSLRWDMDAIAVETWTRLYMGDQRNIRLREDTITELNLLDLDNRHPELVVHRFNQHAERRSGADWEWWIGSGNYWFALRIQAKRMDDLEYRKLGHEGAEDDDYQYDTLIRSSEEATGLIFPLYVFFNGWESWPADVDWYGCPNGNPLKRCGHAADQEFGCAVAPARLVRHIHGGRGKAGRLVGEYLPYSVPWSWILGFPSEASPLVNRRRRPPASRLGPSNPDPNAGGPANPTLLHVLRWHRAWASVAADIDSGRISMEQAATGGGMSRLVVQRQAETGPSIEGLQRLPPYAETIRQLRDRPTDDFSLRDLEAVSSLAGSEPLLVLVTELPFGDQPEESVELLR